MRNSGKMLTTTLAAIMLASAVSVSTPASAWGRYGWAGGWSRPAWGYGGWGDNRWGYGYRVGSGWYPAGPAYGYGWYSARPAYNYRFSGRPVYGYGGYGGW
jgi:hypothetical protein